MVRLGTVAAAILQDVRRAMDRQKAPGIDGQPPPVRLHTHLVDGGPSNKNGTVETGQVAAIGREEERLQGVRMPAKDGGGKGDGASSGRFVMWEKST